MSTVTNQPRGVAGRRGRTGRRWTGAALLGLLVATTLTIGFGPPAPAATPLGGLPSGCFARVEPAAMADGSSNLPSSGGVVAWPQRNDARLTWTTPGGPAAIVMRVVYQASAPVSRRFFFGGAQGVYNLPATGSGYGEWTYYVNVTGTEWMQSDSATTGDLKLASVDYCTYPYTPGAAPTPTAPATAATPSTAPAGTAKTTATTRPAATPSAAAAPAVAVSSAGRHLTRSGANVLPDAGISADLCNANGWTLTYGASLDAAVTHGACGSIQLPNAVTCPLSSTDLLATQNLAQLNERGLCPYAGAAPIFGLGSVARSAEIKVNPGPNGTVMTFAGYLRSEAEPRGTVSITVSAVRSDGSGSTDLTTTEFGNSAIGTWEEFALQANVPAGTTAITVGFNRFAPNSSTASPPAGVSRLWVDDLYLGTGIGYEAPPTPKTAFTGTEVSVDALGNFRRRGADGQMHDFFPMCIATSASRHGGPAGYRFYSSHGWNCVWAADARDWRANADRGVQATDPEFAPNGMCFQLDLNSAIRGVFQQVNGVSAFNWSVNGPGVLQAAIRAINTQGYGDKMCSLLLDAENHTDKLTRVQAVLSMVDATDREANNGARRHPIVSNVGNPGLMRWYRKADGTPLVDVSGTYAGWWGGLQTQDNIEGQTAPGMICQLSSGIGAAFRAQVYRCLAQGSKGVSFWADNGGAQYGSGPVETESWWPDSPIIAREIAQMMPLIRAPHWTTWKVSAGSDPAVYVGTRELNGQGFIIATNNSDQPKTVTLNVSGLGYTPKTLSNYFTGATVASFNGTSVTFTLSPSGNAGSVGGGGGTLVAQLRAAGSVAVAPAKAGGATTATTKPTTKTPTNATPTTKTPTTKKTGTTKKASAAKTSTATTKK